MAESRRSPGHTDSVPGSRAKYIGGCFPAFAASAMQPVVHASPLAVRLVGAEALDTIRVLNQAIFAEERVINTFEREDLTMLVATMGGIACGFKIGYRENRHTFYSAKGGVLPAFRRRGIARGMLRAMEDEARRRGYAVFAYDTFPNRDAGMAILGFIEGYRLVRADFNPTYQDHRLRLERRL